MAVHTLIAHSYTEGEEEPAVDINDPNDTWIIPAGIFAYAHAWYGVWSDEANSTLINRGYINGTYGVVFSVGGGLINNTATGTIVGATGVRIDGAGSAVLNRGTIAGLEGFGVFFDASATGQSLDNYGTVYGSLSAVFAFSLVDGGVINNFGVLRGGSIGVQIPADVVPPVTHHTGPAIVINNHAGATLSGGAFAVRSYFDARAFIVNNEGRITGDIEAATPQTRGDKINNSGRIAGDIDLGLGEDLINNSGQIVGEVRLGEGNDVFNGSRGRSGIILGEADADRLFAGPGNNYVDGGEGDDTLGGGAGNDRLAGGPGEDVFLSGPGADDMHLNLFGGDPALGDGAVDTVRYMSLLHSGTTPATRDEIFGFDVGPETRDLIDVSAIDANGNAPGNGKFKIVTAFTNARGEIRLVVQGANTLLQLDGDNDTAIDATILVRTIGLTGDNFVL